MILAESAPVIMSELWQIFQYPDYQPGNARRFKPNKASRWNKVPF